MALSLMVVVGGGFVSSGENCYLQRRLLRVAVAARYAQSLVMGAYSYSQVSDQPFQWVWSFIVLFGSKVSPYFIPYTENEALTFFTCRILVSG